ncbi:MAG TPA: hypothetical protein VLK84_07385, partial [Longimicrobium sp.]|nr:hypothetical protein [Longimicrobium sp.]
LAAALVTACGPRSMPEAERPAPAAPPAPASASAGPRVSGEAQVCVLRNGALEMIPVRIHPATGDTVTLDGRRLSDVSPASEYAAGSDWYQRNEVIVFRGLNHIQYGLPLQLPPAGLARVGEYRGVSVFADAGETRHGFVYIPAGPGCMFQRYEPPHRQE